MLPSLKAAVCNCREHAAVLQRATSPVTCQHRLARPRAARTVATVQCTVHCTLYILSSHAGRTLTSVPNFPTPASHNPLWRSFNYCFMTLHHLRLQSVSSGGWGGVIYPQICLQRAGTHSNEALNTLNFPAYCISRYGGGFNCFKLS